MVRSKTAVVAKYVAKYHDWPTRKLARLVADSEGWNANTCRTLVTRCRNEAGPVGNKHCRSVYKTPRAKHDRVAAIQGRAPLATPAKILLFDIEASNLSANFGRCLCVGYMWLGDDKPKILSVRTSKAWGRDHTDDHTLVAEVQRVMKSADMWVGWYSSRYDVPFLQTRLLYYGLPLLPPTFPHIDLWRTCRYKLKLHSNRLASAVDFFGLTEKTPIKGEQWVRASAGHKPSLKYVEEHCSADVLALRDAYLVMRPLVYNHPNVQLATDPDAGQRDNCPACGSDKWVEDGTHFGPARAWQRMRCKACGYQRAMSRSKQT